MLLHISAFLWFIGLMIVVSTLMGWKVTPDQVGSGAFGYWMTVLCKVTLDWAAAPDEEGESEQD
jgi:hypothetical protein